MTWPVKRCADPSTCRIHGPAKIRTEPRLARSASTSTASTGARVGHGMRLGKKSGARGPTPRSSTSCIVCRRSTKQAHSLALCPACARSYDLALKRDATTLGIIEWTVRRMQWAMRTT